MREYLDVFTLIAWGFWTAWLYIRYWNLKQDYNNLMKELEVEQLHSRQVKRWYYNGKGER